MRGDINKIVPGYNVVFNDEVKAMIDSVHEGSANAADVAGQIDSLVNAALKEELKTFNEKVGG